MRLLIILLLAPLVLTAQITTHTAGSENVTQSVDISDIDWDLAATNVCNNINAEYARLDFTAAILSDSETLKGSNFSLSDFPDSAPVSNASLNMAIENFTAVSLLTSYSIEVLRTEGVTTTTMFSETGTVTLTLLSLININLDDSNNWDYSTLNGANLDNSTFEVNIQFSYTAGVIVDIGIDEVELEFSTGAALPLTWISTSAEIKNSQAYINWVTADEDNVSHFEIYHSTDNINWESLGDVPTQSSNNNNNNYYYFEDKFPVYGNNYYRIKEVDNDGQFEYSKIESVFYDGINQIVEYRIEVDNDNLNLLSDKILLGKHNFFLYDSMGNLVRSWMGQDSPGYEFNFSIPTALSGIYIFAIEQKERDFHQTIPIFFQGG